MHNPMVMAKSRRSSSQQLTPLVDQIALLDQGFTVYNALDTHTLFHAVIVFGPSSLSELLKLGSRRAMLTSAHGIALHTRRFSIPSRCTRTTIDSSMVLGISFAEQHHSWSLLMALGLKQ